MMFLRADCSVDSYFPQIFDLLDLLRYCSNAAQRVVCLPRFEVAQLE